MENDKKSSMEPKLPTSNEKMPKEDKDKETKRPAENQQKPEKLGTKKSKKKQGFGYSDLASTMAPDLAALNERMSEQAQKEKEMPKPFENQEEVVKTETHGNKESEKKQGNYYSDLAAAMAPELAASNERMSTQSEKETPKAPENQEVKEVIKKKKSKKKEGSGYSELASAMAPELAALNERMSKQAEKEKESQKTSKGAQEAGGKEEPDSPKSCYINLEEIMAQSKPSTDIPVNNFVNNSPQDESDAQRPDLGASRGWFGHFEQQQANKSKISKKKKKKQDHYCELAEAMSSELSKLSFKEPCHTAESKESSEDSTSTGEELEEPTFKQIPPPVTDIPDCQQQQDFGNKIKRPKKQGKKKTYYAQLAEDISPMVEAMNKRLEEQNKETIIEVRNVENEVPLLSSSPESSSEPFVFVSSNEGHSLFDEGLEIVESRDTCSKPSFDTIPDCPGATSPSCKGEKDNAEPNLICFDDGLAQTQMSGNSNADMKEMVKEILKEVSNIHEC